MRDVNIDVPDQLQDEDEYEDTYPKHDLDYEEGRGDYLYHLRKDNEMDD